MMFLLKFAGELLNDINGIGRAAVTKHGSHLIFCLIMTLLRDGGASPN